MKKNTYLVVNNYCRTKKRKNKSREKERVTVTKLRFLCSKAAAEHSTLLGCCVQLCVVIQDCFTILHSLSKF